jgi:hypothetical protein
MPFIGNKPSAVPLTSADIADSIITSAKIVDGTIVNADINASAAIDSTKLTGVGATAGQVIQVVSATDETIRSTTSDSYVTASNTLSISITPSSASNKIYLIAHCGRVIPGSDGIALTIFRGATDLGQTNGRGFNIVHFDSSTPSLTFLDSPSTTSATTYQVYIKRLGGAGTPQINYSDYGSQKAVITAFEIKG